MDAQTLSGSQAKCLDTAAQAVCCELKNGYLELLREWANKSPGQDHFVFHTRMTIGYGRKFVSRVEQALQQACEEHNLTEAELCKAIAKELAAKPA